MSIKVKKKTEFQLLREIREVREKIDSIKEGMVKSGRINDIDLMQKLTILKNELRIVRTKTATGEEAESVKRYWSNMVAEEKKKAKRKLEEDKKNIEKAKKELKENKETIKEMARDLSVEELEELLKNKKKEKVVSLI
jgi:uncharacterized protein (DUF3084 family)